MHRLSLRLLWLVFVALVVAPRPAAADSVTLTWEQESPSNIAGYKVSLDGAVRDYGATLVGAGGSCVCSVALSVAAGTHTVIITAYNSAGEAASAPLTFEVGAVTTPRNPGAPASASPVTGATGVATTALLTWSSTGATSYDIRLGTTNPPLTLVGSMLPTAAYQRVLEKGTTYFWQIVARNSTGTTTGPVWLFTTASTSTTALPAPWTSRDIGDVGVAGGATFANGTFTVNGAGLDIWGTADAFQYVAQPLAGDGVIVGRVTALQDTHSNAKAGLMMRGALTAEAQHVMINAMPDGQIEFITRSATGTAATYLAGGWQPRPAWLRLTRVGATVTGEASSDGQAWSLVASTTVAGLAYTGVIVTSHVAGVANVSTFDSVTVTVPAVRTTGVATLTSPASGATNVNLTLPIQWARVPDAQAYSLYGGTTLGARDLINSREIQENSFVATGVPAGKLVYARIWTKVGGVWRFSDSTFTTSSAAVTTVAALTAPLDGATNVSRTVPIQWTAVPNAQAYSLYVGTTQGARDLVNSREIQQTSFPASGLPSGRKVFARIWTKVGGVWRFQDSTFTTAAVR